METEGRAHRPLASRWPGQQGQLRDVTCLTPECPVQDPRIAEKGHHPLQGHLMSSMSPSAKLEIGALNQLRDTSHWKAGRRFDLLQRRLNLLGCQHNISPTTSIRFARICLSRCVVSTFTRVIHRCNQFCGSFGAIGSVGEDNPVQSHNDSGTPGFRNRRASLPLHLPSAATGTTQRRLQYAV